MSIPFDLIKLLWIITKQQCCKWFNYLFQVLLNYFNWLNMEYMRSVLSESQKAHNRNFASSHHCAKSLLTNGCYFKKY